jgi:hypothetical protein
MTSHQQDHTTTLPGQGELCLALRGEFSRLGIELPALAPLARCGAVREDDGEPSPLIWLGTCDPTAGQRLLDVLRGCGA